MDVATWAVRNMYNYMEQSLCRGTHTVPMSPALREHKGLDSVQRASCLLKSLRATSSLGSMSFLNQPSHFSCYYPHASCSVWGHILSANDPWQKTVSGMVETTVKSGAVRWEIRGMVETKSWRASNYCQPLVWGNLSTGVSDRTLCDTVPGET